ncbi:MAG: ATP-binding protein [Chlamydiales bacterium]|nr:ATP-binding protein [Chlamydiales bacterium]
MQKYHKRLIEPLITKYLDNFSVVGITGPRQSGKSTVLKHLLKDSYTYVTFDDYMMVELFTQDPKKFMQVYSNKVIFDEVQKVPELFHYIKLAVDNDRSNYGKFILTGSSQFSFIQKITESLAGRIGLLTLLPFQYLELPDSAKQDGLYEGGFPELINRNFSLKNEWYAAYLETYIEKDVRQVYDIGNIRDFRKLIRLLAANIGNILNLSRFANDLGVAVSTVKKWISVLEASYILFLLPAYTTNKRKNIIKSPKVYFYDNGLVSYLCGITTRELFDQGPMAGALFENYIVAEIQKNRVNLPRPEHLYFYKEQRGAEVDLVIDDHPHRTLIEIKNSATFRPKMVEHLEKLRVKNEKGILVYQGEDLPDDGEIQVLNYHHFLSSSS